MVIGELTCVIEYSLPMETCGHGSAHLCSPVHLSVEACGLRSAHLYDPVRLSIETCGHGSAHLCDPVQPVNGSLRRNADSIFFGQLSVRGEEKSMHQPFTFLFVLINFSLSISLAD